MEAKTAGNRTVLRRGCRGHIVYIPSHMVRLKSARPNARKDSLLRVCYIK